MNRYTFTGEEDKGMNTTTRCPVTHYSESLEKNQFANYLNIFNINKGTAAGDFLFLFNFFIHDSNFDPGP
jgi:hypothetical protein